MKQPYVVVFAGAQGSSKSIIAHSLSMAFGLPILNRDVIRSEVKEDLLASNINEPRALEEFEERFKRRWKKALQNGKNFILDGSVDRSWQDTKNDLRRAEYRWFMVDMELSREFFTELFTATGRREAIEELGRYLGDHEKFLRQYADDITLKITDESFGRRRELAVAGLRDFLEA